MRKSTLREERVFYCCDYCGQPHATKPTVCCAADTADHKKNAKFIERKFHRVPNYGAEGWASLHGYDLYDDGDVTEFAVAPNGDCITISGEGEAASREILDHMVRIHKMGLLLTEFWNIQHTLLGENAGEEIRAIIKLSKINPYLGVGCNA